MAYGVNNSPFGLRPVGTLNNSPWQLNLVKRNIALNYATALYPGDLVTVVAGFIERAPVTAAATPGQIFGVFQSCQYTTANPVAQPVIKSKVWPGSAGANPLANSEVIANITWGDVVYEIQADDTLANGVTFAQSTSSGLFVQNAPNQTLKTSGVALGALGNNVAALQAGGAGSYGQTFGTDPLKLVGQLSSVGSYPTNVWGAKWNTVLVMINTPFTATYQPGKA
jgi:hypothetical protein